MKIMISCCTDAGTIKAINQDALSVKLVNSPLGEIVLAVVCDGVGGLDFGEQASRETVMAFHNWFATEFPALTKDAADIQKGLFSQWEKLIGQLNGRLKTFAESQGKRMGTTLSALLICQEEYYLCHVGDSRIYRIDDSVHKLTVDHTLVERELKRGILTAEQARVDKRRNVLLQCIGASSKVEPQFSQGQIQADTTFLISSDGFVHLISEEELYEYFYPGQITDKEQLSGLCRQTVQTLMNRGEQDNITVIAVAVKEVKSESRKEREYANTWKPVPC